MRDSRKAFICKRLIQENNTNGALAASKKAQTPCIRLERHTYAIILIKIEDEARRDRALDATRNLFERCVDAVVR